MKMQSKWVTMISVLIAMLATGGRTEDQEDEFPKEVVQEDLVLNRDNVFGEIEKNEKMFVLFYDRVDKSYEKVVSQVRLAIKDLAEKGHTVRFGSYEAPLVPRVEKEFKIYKFPKLIYFQDGERYPYNGGKYRRHIVAWHKRLQRNLNMLVSLKAESREQIAKLINTEYTAVVYCGFSKQDREFKIYEVMAQDSKHVYLHSFDEDMCRKMKLREMGKDNEVEYEIQKEVNMTKEEQDSYMKGADKVNLDLLDKGEIDEDAYEREYYAKPPKTKIVNEKFFNETLWNMSRIEKPVIFIAQKNVEEPSAMKILENITDVKDMRRRIRWLTTAAYYTDKDIVHQRKTESKNADNWLYLFYPHNETRLKRHKRIVRDFKQFAREQLFKVKGIKFAVLKAEEIMFMKLEPLIPPDGYNRLYYVKHRENGKLLEKIKKHKMTNIKTLGDIKKAFGYLNDNTWDEYFFTEDPVQEGDEHYEPQFQKLNREEYFSEVKNRVGNLAIVAHNGWGHKLNKVKDFVMQCIERLSGLGVKNIKFVNVDVSKNDLDSEIKHVSSSPKFILYSSDSIEPKSAVNLESVDELLRFLKGEIESVQEVIEDL